MTEKIETQIALKLIRYGIGMDHDNSAFRALTYNSLCSEILKKIYIDIFFRRQHISVKNLHEFNDITDEIINNYLNSTGGIRISAVKKKQLIQRIVTSYEINSKL